MIVGQESNGGFAFSQLVVI